jgi:hypothetical protein
VIRVAWRGFQSRIRNQKSQAENEPGLRTAASARRNYTTLPLKEQQLVAMPDEHRRSTEHSSWVLNLHF